MNIKYSIIVAAYNVENYLGKCLKSLRTLDYENYEVIVIDDGSTDNTYEIASRYKCCDNFKVVSQANRGTAIARIEGVKLASGDFVLFVDGDDYIKRTSLNLVDSYVDNVDADIYHFGYIRDYGIYRKEMRVPDGLYMNAVDDISIMRTFFGGGNEIITAHVTSKVYKIELLQSIVDVVNKYVVYGEDIYINLMILMNCNIKSILSVSRSWYFYRQGIGAMSKLDLSIVGSYQNIRTIQRNTILFFHLPDIYNSMLHRESLNILLHYSALSIEKLTFSEFVNEIETQLNSLFIKEAIKYYKMTNSTEGYIKSLIAKDYNQYYDFCKQYLKELGFINRVKLTINKKIHKFSR